MLSLEGPLTKPGLIVTGTDTDVGKTVVTCAIAAVLRQQRRGVRLGVCKPFASGCRRDREGLVSSDAEALAHFADCRLPLSVVSPLTFRPPLAPASAAEEEDRKIDWPALARALRVLDDRCDGLIIEGVGGAMVPLDPAYPRYTFRDLAAALHYPVVVVCRATLGTLNHTAMTVHVLQEVGCRVVGLVVNGQDTDAAAEAADPSLRSNRRWLERLTGIKVLTTVPKVRTAACDPAGGKLDPAVLNAVGQVDWATVMAPSSAR
jgi:dethiobiotin synthetase